MGKWYETSTGNHQGLIIEEVSGKNIAVAYDKKDAPLIAAAPGMLQALEAIVARINGEWDNPALIAYGALSHNPNICILRIAEMEIREAKGGA